MIERTSGVPNGWTPLLTAHVAAGIVVLITGPLLFLPVSERTIRLHPVVGIVYALCSLGVLLPSGWILSFYAHGGFWGRMGFFLTGLWMFIAVGMGLLRLRERRWESHRAWMVRGFAMATSALTFRGVYIIGYLLGIPYEWNYPGSTWFSSLFNFLLAEVFLSNVFIPNPKESNYENPIHPPSDPASVYAAGG
ncbi:MAG: DUF2306 domain-containing protein [Kiritimatiellae bacterium]|nr:DUF2306 domain-containing protein [Kiritimatiellia bacterium]